MIKVSESLLRFEEEPTAPEKVRELAERILRAYREIRSAREQSSPARLAAEQGKPAKPVSD